MSNLSDFLGGGAPKVWVTGTTYAAGVVVFSPTDFQYFMRKIAGAGSTDPSSDATNWHPTGDRAVKSIQRGVIALAGGVTSGTATITSVVTAKTELRYLGCDGVNMNDNIGKIVLTNATTITATKAASTGSVNVSWELTERY